MNRLGYNINDQKSLYYVTFTTVYWIDIFTRTVYKDILIDNFRFYMENQGLKIHAYVIMSNHLHAILSATQSKNDLSSIIGRFKSMTSKQIVEVIKTENESRREWMLALFKKAALNNKRNKTYQVWQQHNHPIELDNAEIARQKLNYIHENPVKAQIVSNEEDYLYSSAKKYAGLPGFLKIDFLDLGLER